MKAIVRSLVVPALALLVGGLAGAKLDGVVARAFVTPEVPQKYIDRLELLSKIRPSGEIAFVGNSHVERGLWRDLLDEDVANYGVSGDGAANAFRRMSSLPQNRVLVLVGVNDVIGGRSVRDIVESFSTMLDAPEKSIILLSIMPTHGRYAKHNDRISAVNREIEELCTGACVFVDTWPAMSEDGSLAEKYSYDGLHLNADGYYALASLIKPVVAGSGV